METALASAPEGEDPKSAEQVVVEVLGEKSTFLQNVGIRPVLPKAGGQNNAELEAERRANAELRSLVNTQRMQIEVLSKKLLFLVKWLMCHGECLCIQFLDEHMDLVEV
jgi:hypothetical protein